ncbi:MAG: glycosyltransferase family 39 protein [Taibaiella sp.]|nr:glycosyltransferase family 39 protein [Taibaiella sp.]
MRSFPSAPISMRIPVLLLIVIFVVLKLPHLAYPFYWDESWPYASALKTMFLNGPSLAPWAIHPDLGRGHPLLFHFLVASWMKLFGDSNMAMHSFSLFVATILITCIYETVLRLFGMKPAFFASALFATQEMFFVQSSLLLPEVLVALFSLSGLYCYATRQYRFSALLVTAVVLTKESGLVLVALLAAESLLALATSNSGIKEKLARMACFAIPSAIYASFLILQKHTHGWYFYPLHTGFIETNFDGFWYRFRFACLTDLFTHQYRQYFYVIGAVFSVTFAVKKRDNGGFALPILVLLCYCILADKLPGRLPSAFWFPLLVVNWTAATYFSIYRSNSFTPHQKRFLILASAFVMLFLIFSAANFYTTRYLMTPLAMTTILLPPIFEPLLSRKGIAPYLLTLAMLSVSLAHYRKTSGHGDTELGTFDAMKVERATTRYLENHQYQELYISTGAFLQSIHLTEPTTGFLSGTKAFRHLKWEIDDTTQLAIFDSIEPDERISAIKTDTAFYLLFRATCGREWAEIYKRRPATSGF